MASQVIVDSIVGLTDPNYVKLPEGIVDGVTVEFYTDQETGQRKIRAKVDAMHPYQEQINLDVTGTSAQMTFTPDNVYSVICYFNNVVGTYGVHFTVNKVDKKVLFPSALPMGTALYVYYLTRDNLGE